jgi:membrane protease YdiL (CAAX protease family)
VNKRHITIITATLVGVFAFLALPQEASGDYGWVAKDNYNWPFSFGTQTKSGFITHQPQYGWDENGKTLWTFTSSNSISGGPIIYDVNDDNINETLVSYSGENTYALDENGSILWSNDNTGHLGIADLTGSSAPEIVVSTDTGMVVLSLSGNELYTGDDLDVPPNFADVQGDSALEIIGMRDSGDNDKLVVFDNSGNELWSKSIGAGPSTPSVADMGTDGNPEIIAAGGDGVFCYDGQGNRLWRWDSGRTGGMIGPAVYDVNSDGIPEVSVTSNDDYMYLLDNNGGLIWEFNSGSDFFGTYEPFGKPTMGNFLEDDSEGEVIGGLSFNNMAYVRSHDNEEDLWIPTTAGTRLPYILDINSDGKNELVYQMDGHINIYNQDNENIWSGGFSGNISELMAIGDTNNNNSLEIVTGDSNGTLKAFGIENVPESPSGSSVLNVKAEVPDYTDNITINVTGPGTSVAKSMRPGFVENITGLASGSYTVEAPEISGYSFERWSGDISSPDRSTSVHLSEKTVIANYEKVLGSVPPTPPEDKELSIEVETGISKSGTFIEKEEFTQGSAVAVRAVLEYGGDRLPGQETTGSFREDDFRMTGRGNGTYLGSFQVGNEAEIGRHVVKVTSDTDHGSITGSDTFSITSWQSPEPEEFPSWFPWFAVLALIAFLFLAYLTEDEWGKTPKNVLGGSPPGSWTFSLGNLAVIGLFLAALIAVGLHFGLVSEGTIFYMILFGAIALGFAAELSDVKNPSAVIGFTTEHWAGLVAGGAAFGLGYVYLATEMTNAMGMSMYPMSLLEAAGVLGIGSGAMMLIVGALSIPIIEEGCFRGILSPLTSELTGIAASLLAVSAAFGLVHVIFGGGLGIFLTAFLFSLVVGYFTLRNQTLLFAIPAHVSYNAVVFAIGLSVSMVAFLALYGVALAVSMAVIWLFIE